MFRVGIGKDIHRFAEGRKLILGGIEIPFKKGLEGHSDADALSHAIIDAMLGALSLGDIGKHFPDTDSRYKDISSIELLKRVGDLLKKKGWGVVNIDTVVVLQEPRLSKFTRNMIEKIAETLNLRFENVSVKATTGEGLGFVGMGEGILVDAVVLLKKNDHEEGSG